MTEQVQKVMENLRRNRMAVEYVATKEEVLPLVKSLLPIGCTVTDLWAGHCIYRQNALEKIPWVPHGIFSKRGEI